MDFPIIFVFGGIIAVTVIIMSLVFIKKALKRATAIGMDKKIIKNTITSSAIFSIVPSMPIVIGVGIMSSYMGLAIPWIRLTVIGALQYEIIAMDQVNLTTQLATPALIATAFVIMTIAILSGPIFNMVFYKKYQTKLKDLGDKDKTMLDNLTGALLGGLLAGIASYIIAGGIFGGSSDFTQDGSIEVNGTVTLLTLLTSAVIMALCGLGMKVFKWKWMENYALPITILGSIGAAFLFISLF